LAALDDHAGAHAASNEARRRLRDVGLDAHPIAASLAAGRVGTRR
jgi:hypothetical protein